MRPLMEKMGHSKKYLENLSASSVADVTISFRSGLFWVMPCETSLSQTLPEGSVTFAACFIELLAQPAKGDGVCQADTA